MYVSRPYRARNSNDVLSAKTRVNLDRNLNKHRLSLLLEEQRETRMPDGCMAASAIAGADP